MSVRQFRSILWFLPEVTSDPHWTVFFFKWKKLIKIVIDKHFPSPITIKVYLGLGLVVFLIACIFIYPDTVSEVNSVQQCVAFFQLLFLHLRGDSKLIYSCSLVLCCQLFSGLFFVLNAPCAVSRSLLVFGYASHCSMRAMIGQVIAPWGPLSRRSRKGFRTRKGPESPQNLKRYDYRAVLFIYS